MLKVREQPCQAKDFLIFDNLPDDATQYFTSTLKISSIAAGRRELVQLHDQTSVLFPHAGEQANWPEQTTRFRFNLDLNGLNTPADKTQSALLGCNVEAEPA